jgi:hypothetical protein
MLIGAEASTVGVPRPPVMTASVTVSLHVQLQLGAAVHASLARRVTQHGGGSLRNASFTYKASFNMDTHSATQRAHMHPILTWVARACPSLSKYSIQAAH